MAGIRDFKASGKPGSQGTRFLNVIQVILTRHYDFYQAVDFSGMTDRIQSPSGEVMDVPVSVNHSVMLVHETIAPGTFMSKQTAGRISRHVALARMLVDANLGKSRDTVDDQLQLASMDDRASTLVSDADSLLQDALSRQVPWLDSIDVDQLFPDEGFFSGDINHPYLAKLMSVVNSIKGRHGSQWVEIKADRALVASINASVEQVYGKTLLKGDVVELRRK